MVLAHATAPGTTQAKEFKRSSKPHLSTAQLQGRRMFNISSVFHDHRSAECSIFHRCTMIAVQQPNVIDDPLLTPLLAPGCDTTLMQLMQRYLAAMPVSNST
ncbi:hypothetical protein J6590_013421 [Homalodisca vitripennis]|nr:hypothetical protein J6590_013421 [Homalodisca vitripennis]